MRFIKWLFVLTFLLLLSWFSYLNATPVAINFFSIHYSLSIAFIVLITILLTVVFNLILFLPSLLACSLQNKKLKKRLKLKEQEISNLRHISVKGIYDE